MNLFAVFKKGVYRHECGGIFSTLEAADAAALSLINGERDGYHEYQIVPFVLDVKTEQSVITESGWGGELNEAACLVEYHRSKDGTVTRNDRAQA